MKIEVLIRYIMHLEKIYIFLCISIYSTVLCKYIALPDGYSQNRVLSVSFKMKYCNVSNFIEDRNQNTLFKGYSLF